MIIYPLYFCPDLSCYYLTVFLMFLYLLKNNNKKSTLLGHCDLITIGSVL